MMSLRGVKFIITGGVNTAVSYLGFATFIWLGLGYLSASSLGYFLGIINSYVMNKRWTFDVDTKSSINLVSQFIVINLLALSVNLCVMYYLVDGLGLNVYWAQAIAILFTMVISYVGYKWIFTT